jgi:hypothetical protein
MTLPGPSRMIILVPVEVPERPEREPDPGPVARARAQPRSGPAEPVREPEPVR